MTINYQYIHIFIILLIFNFTLINNTPRPPDEVAEPDEGTSIYADLTSEWEQKMQDFKFEYIYYIPINPREQEIYFENVTTVPSTFKGGYFLSDESTNKIEFYIKDSENRIIYEAKAHHNLFEFNVTKADRYSIIFINFYKSKKSIYKNIYLLLYLLVCISLLNLNSILNFFITLSSASNFFSVSVNSFFPIISFCPVFIVKVTTTFSFAILFLNIILYLSAFVTLNSNKL